MSPFCYSVTAPVDFPFLVSGGQVFLWREQSGLGEGWLAAPARATPSSRGGETSNKGLTTAPTGLRPGPASLPKQQAIWHGVHGPDWYEVRVGERLEVTSSAPESEFHRLFSLTPEWDAAVNELRADPRLTELLDRHPGLRLVRPRVRLEGTVCFLCTSNNHLPRITAMIERLWNLGPGRDGRRLFPDLAALLPVNEERLREWGFGYRGRTIPLALRALADHGGEEWLASLDSEPMPTVRRELMTLAGVGPKLAECIALFGLGRWDAAPVDTHVWQSLGRWLRPDWAGLALSARRITEASDWLRGEFGPYAGIVQQFLFTDNLRRPRGER